MMVMMMIVIIKDREDHNSIIRQRYLTDIYKVLHTTATYTLFSSTHGISLREIEEDLNK